MNVRGTHVMICVQTQKEVFFVHAAREANLAWPWMAEHASVKIYFLYCFKKYVTGPNTHRMFTSESFTASLKGHISSLRKLR